MRIPTIFTSFSRIKTVICLFIFVTLSAELSAQISTEPTWQFKFGGKITEFNEKKQKDLALEGAIVTLLKGPVQVQTVTTNNTGRFKFTLDPNNEYTVTVTKPGYITKRFTISTHNVPAERGEGAFAEFDVEIGLFKLFPGLNYGCLDKPIAKIRYNPAPDVDDFDYDKVYTQSIQACIDELKRLEAEARAKQKLYDAAIEAADKLFGQSNWQGAKDKYNEALTYLPNEQYPKDQIAKCDEKMGGIAKAEADYKAALAEADRLFAASDWAGAKAQYQKASGLKTTEQYPKDQIVKCDNNIAAAGKKAAYDAAIKDADAKFTAKDFAGAKTKYQEASGMMPTEVYPKDQMKKCDEEIAKAANKAKYDAAIADADAKFKASDFTNAKAKYQEASGIMPSEQYPKDQIVKCDAEIAKQGLDKQYNDAIAAADAKFKAADFAGAKTDYQKASGLKSAEQYPKDQIAKCDAEIAKAGLDKAYNDAIAAADAKFKTSDWAGAKVDYQKASALKTAEQYPKDQIAKCDAEIAKAGLDKSYNDAIAAADAKFKSSDWAGAKADYQKASGLKAAEQYPKDQIAKCDAEIAKAGLDKSYNDAIAAADAKFKAKDWAGAKTKYQEASGLKSAEQYPKDQIAKCDAEIAAKGLQDQYNAAIKDADAKFKAADWSGAKAKYQDASALKAEEQYPKDQIAKCDAEIAKKGVQEQYDALIKDADAKFKAADFTGAKSVYTQALDLKSAEAYPKAQIAKCDAEIAKKGVQEQYDAIIKDADAKFGSSDWAAAKAKYQEASALKSAEAYPKAQIAKCDANMNAAAKESQYKTLIARADSSFKSSDWAGAKAIYQQASVLKTAEQYPKDQMAKCDAEIAKLGKDKQYNDLIAKADVKFGASDWAGAKTIYQQASGVKPDEAYPKDQIAKCDANVAAAKDAAYNKIVASADSLFKLPDYAAAKAKYKEANTSRPNDAYPKDQMAKCDAEIAKLGKDKQYNDLIAKADTKFGASDWAGAKTLYQQASGVKAEEQYPKDQIAKCDANIAGAKDAAYNKIIAKADSLFGVPDYSAAKLKYKEANTSRPDEQYPKDQIAKCDAEIAKLGKDKQYTDLIAKADAKFNASAWAEAKTLYQQALGVKADEAYPKDQITKCDNNIANAGTQTKYDAAIKAADTKFKLNDWNGAKAKYQEALGIKAGEQYPTDQIRICDDNIANAANKKYTDAIAAADAKFNAVDYSGAKTKYQEASAMRPNEQYPKDQIAKCDAEIAKQGLDKTYLAAIAAADAKFKASDWKGAKAKYQEALGLKEGEQYPKDQIAACDKNIADALGMEERYAHFIQRADSAFKAEDYETAKSGYESALGVKPGQAYPTAQLAEINKRLAALDAANAKDAKYRATIAKADSLFNAKDFKGAKVQYQSASTQKPNEQYPKDRIALCDTEVANAAFEAAKQKKYDDLIKKADAKFNAGAYADAKKLYQDALKEKPVELYPKQQIDKCDKKLNPTAKADTARTPEQIKEDYRNEIAKTYPQGLTQIEENDGGTKTTKRIVVIGEHGYIYTKKVYSWGTFYFKDGVQISEGTFNYETSPTYIQQQQQNGSK